MALQKISFLLLLFVSVFARAQSPADSVFATLYQGRFFLLHAVEGGQSLPRIAERYGVTTEALNAENGISFPQQISPGTTLRIPMSQSNLLMANGAETAPVYYRCAGRENLVVLAGSIGRTFRNLQDINPGLKQYAVNGSLLLLGYLQKGKVRPDEIIPEKDAPKPDTTPKEKPVVKTADTTAAPVESEAEKAFKSLAETGVQMAEQTGPVTFFPGGVKTTYFAFHATAGRGTILRIRNPANGKAVYAKVIGPLPVTKNYYKALAGVSDNARKALGAPGDARLWCEVAYAEW